MLEMIIEGSFESESDNEAMHKIERFSDAAEKLAPQNAFGLCFRVSSGFPTKLSQVVMSQLSSFENCFLMKLTFDDRAEKPPTFSSFKTFQS